MAGKIHWISIVFLQAYRIFKVGMFFMHTTSLNKDSPFCAFETDRREMLSSIPGHVCRPSRSEFTLVFSESRINMS